MRNPFFTLLIVLAFSHSFHCCFAQDNKDITQVVYLIGNTATSDIREAQLASLQQHLLTEKHPFALVHLGDIIKPGDPDKQANELDHLFGLIPLLHG